MANLGSGGKGQLVAGVVERPDLDLFVVLEATEEKVLVHAVLCFEEVMHFVIVPGTV